MPRTVSPPRWAKHANAQDHSQNLCNQSTGSGAALPTGSSSRSWLSRRWCGMDKGRGCDGERAQGGQGDGEEEWPVGQQHCERWGVGGHASAMFWA